MRLTEHIDVSGGRTTMTVTQDGEFARRPDGRRGACSRSIACQVVHEPGRRRGSWGRRTPRPRGAVGG